MGNSADIKPPVCIDVVMWYTHSIVMLIVKSFQVDMDNTYTVYLTIFRVEMINDASWEIYGLAIQSYRFPNESTQTRNNNRVEYILNNIADDG